MFGLELMNIQDLRIKTISSEPGRSNAVSFDIFCYKYYIKYIFHIHDHIKVISMLIFLFTKICKNSFIHESILLTIDKYYMTEVKVRSKTKMSVAIISLVKEKVDVL